jgi:hypothetical protein
VKAGREKEIIKMAKLSAVAIDLLLSAAASVFL